MSEGGDRADWTSNTGTSTLERFAVKFPAVGRGALTYRSVRGSLGREDFGPRIIREIVIRSGIAEAGQLAGAAVRPAPRELRVERRLTALILTRQSPDSGSRTWLSG